MEDMPVRSSVSSDRWLFETVVQAAGAGAFIGAVMGIAVGAVMGAAVGWHNEATLTGDDYEELSIGFGEYSMRGMATGCAIICAIYGGVAGAVSASSAWASQRRMVGLVVGLSLPLVLWETTDLFHDGRKQAGFVWCAGMLVGDVTAGLFCARRKEMPCSPAERGAAPHRPRG
jgi:hypothetical protein